MRDTLHLASWTLLMDGATLLKRAGTALLLVLALGLALQGKALAQHGPRINAIYQDRLTTDPGDPTW